MKQNELDLLVFLFPITVSLLTAVPCMAESWDNEQPSLSNTVIYLDFYNRRSLPFWGRLEQRLSEELGGLHLSVLTNVVNGSPNDYPAERLKAIAENENAIGAFYIIRQQGETARLFLFVGPHGETPGEYKKIDIEKGDNDSLNEAVEVVALKTVEALQASFMVEPLKEEKSPAQVVSNIPEHLYIKITPVSFTNPQLKPLKVLTIVTLGMGLATLGVAGELHYQKLIRENMINKYYYENDYDSWEWCYNEYYSEYKSFLKGIRILYPIGGVITGMGLVCLGLFLKARNGESRQENKVSFSLSRTGVTLDF